MIKVLFFAHLQDEVGKETLTIDKAPLTIAELKVLLSDQFELQNVEQLMFAINEEYAQENDVIQAGDIVALIPPVSGG
ncbi:molybdopterin converting factor subunit 1 [Cytobacillus sp. Hm23]